MMPGSGTLPPVDTEGRAGCADPSRAGDANGVPRRLSDNERLDYFFHPDRFFSRLFSREYYFIAPCLLLLVSLLPAILFWRIMAGY
jgi:hypothetical protein